MLRMSLAPCAPFTVDNELMIEAAKMARETPGVRLHTHLAENQEDIDYSLKVYGCRPGEYLKCGLTSAFLRCTRVLPTGLLSTLDRLVLTSKTLCLSARHSIPTVGGVCGQHSDLSLHMPSETLTLLRCSQAGGLGQGRLLVRALLHAGQGGAETVCGQRVGHRALPVL